MKRAVARFVRGFLKGAFWGSAVALVLLLGFGKAQVPSLLSYALGALSGATAAFFCGIPPWRTKGNIERILKLVVGGALGLGFSAILINFADTPFPADWAKGLEHVIMPSESWTTVPFAFLPVVGGMIGAFVEFDEAPRISKVKSVERLRVEEEDSEQLLEDESRHREVG